MRRFKAFQRSVDRLEVLIEKGPTFTTGDLDDIRAKWVTYLGKNIRIDFKLVDKIPPDPGGKLRCVVSDIR